MILQEIAELMKENKELKVKLEEQKLKVEGKKPEMCANCKHYIQHYGRTDNGVYFKIHAGHCTCDVPVKKGGKKRPVPDDSCQYFEIGQR